MLHGENLYIVSGNSILKLMTDYIIIINNCLPINRLLEKQCMKFTSNIINSEHSLQSRIALYSLCNGDTILGENII